MEVLNLLGGEYTYQLLSSLLWTAPGTGEGIWLHSWWGALSRGHILRSSGGSSDLSVSLLRGQQTVSVKDQVVNTIGFVGHMVSVHVQLYCPSLKAA